jgi:hypothetical protein
MNFMRFKKQYVFVAFIMLPTAGYGAPKGKPHLEQITINNKYGAPVALEIKWRDRHGAHTEQLQDIQINPGQQTIKAPLLGYYAIRIIATPSSMVAAGVMMVAWQGHIHAHKNRYFVVTPGPIPAGALKGKLNHKADIDGYANEQAYKDSLVAKPVTPATPASVTPGTPATPAPVVVATSPVPTPAATPAPAK